MIKLQPVYINKWLLPLSWLYGCIVFIRNKFFDAGILKREEFDIPVICVGNITVGGTGKTPHTEYLIRLLKDKYNIAVLSRGYGRKTKGFLLSDTSSTSLQIGDEPFQIKYKFPEIIVAVDGNRRRGIRELLALENPPEVILLDDAFQHRYVKPSYSIVLSDYNRPIYEDKLLPAGRLREPAYHHYKANMVLVTKCPEDMQPIDYRIIFHDMKTLPFQGLYFTSLVYKQLKNIYDTSKEYPLTYLKNKDILLVTGIASPKMLINKLSEYSENIESITYPDHYNFKSKDIKHISSKFNSITSQNKLILVTEKDAARLLQRTDINEDLKQYIYCLPIEVSFMNQDEENEFKYRILEHVRENKRNSVIYSK